jgi:hypothetical protein
VSQANRALLIRQGADEADSFGEVSDRLDLARRHPDLHQLFETAVGGQDAECAVLRIDEVHGGLDDRAQQCRQIEVLYDGLIRAEQRALAPLRGSHVLREFDEGAECLVQIRAWRIREREHPILAHTCSSASTTKAATCAVYETLKRECSLGAAGLAPSLVTEVPDLRCGPEDEHRAVSVLGAGCAHGAEQETCEAAVTAGAQNDHLCAIAFFDERSRGRPGYRRHAEPRWSLVSEDLVRGGFEDLARIFFWRPPCKQRHFRTRGI